MSLAFALTAAFVSPAAHAQTYTVLYSFRGGADGGDPFAGLILDRVGNLYGTTSPPSFYLIADVKEGRGFAEVRRAHACTSRGRRLDPRVPW
jgi:hypothetical protein